MRNWLQEAGATPRRPGRQPTVSGLLPACSQPGILVVSSGHIRRAGTEQPGTRGCEDRAKGAAPPPRPRSALVTEFPRFRSDWQPQRASRSGHRRKPRGRRLGRRATKTQTRSFDRGAPARALRRRHPPSRDLPRRPRNRTESRRRRRRRNGLGRPRFCRPWPPRSAKRSGPGRKPRGATAPPRRRRRLRRVLQSAATLQHRA